MTESGLLAEVKQRLAEGFGGRFKGLVLCGARGCPGAGAEDARRLLVLLDGPVDLADDLATIEEALYLLHLQTDRGLDVVPADVRQFESGATPFLAAARRHGTWV